MDSPVEPDEIEFLKAGRPEVKSLASDEDFLSAFDEIERHGVQWEMSRARVAAEIAAKRLLISKWHRLESGQKLDLNLYRFQRAIYEDASPEIVITGSTQWGKPLRIGSLVFTSTGWKKIEDIRVGDLVVTVEGTYAPVTGVFPQGRKQLFRLTTEDGRTVESCEGHNWEVLDRRPVGKKHMKGSVSQISTTAEIIQSLSKGHRVYLPLPSPAPMPESKQPLDPYLVGALIGDGGLTTKYLRFTNVDPDVIDRVRRVIPDGFELHQYPSDAAGNYHIRRNDGKRRGKVNAAGRDCPNVVIAGLNEIGLWGLGSHERFIPEAYKTASVEQRWALIQGLFDTDGYAATSPSFTTTSFLLAKDVQEVIWSLGGVARIVRSPSHCYSGGIRKRGRDHFDVRVRHSTPEKFFGMRRKIERLTTSRKIAGGVWLEIDRIEPTVEDEAICIAVDHPRHLFLTNGFVCTRNTEYLICHAIASAACGLKVLFVCAKKEQREKLVKTRFDPVLRSVPLYKRLADQAIALGKNTDSTLIKQIGDGSIVFLNSQVKNDFISQPGSLAIVDEYQYAKLDNIAMLADRLSGSDEQFYVFVGNPLSKGTESNQNLDWQYQLSDQRKWYVPCNFCRTEQVLDWETNVVKVVRNKFGGILSVSARDETWVQDSPVDIKPVCVKCGQPMNRLHQDAFWRAEFPGRRRHGYQLSNLYNPKKRLDTLYSQFLSAQHQPGLLAQFYNNQMGIPYNTDGSSITEAMLQACSTGELGGAGKADPYQFLPASQIQWRDAA